MSHPSKILGPRALRAFNRIGDMMIPRDDKMPSFSELGCIEHVDSVAAYAPQEDLKMLNLFLTVLSFLPDFLLRGLIALVKASPGMSGPHGVFFRQLDVGLRSVIVTLYYSGKKGHAYRGKTPLELIGFEIVSIRD